jgi:hypothetical protein
MAMTIADLLGAVVEFMIGDGDSDGILGGDFAIFIATGLVLGLATTQLPKLVKRFR